MKHLAALTVLLGPVSGVSAQFIWVNLSFKAVLNPADGRRSFTYTETEVDAAIAHANEWMANHWRGYRFRRSEPIQDIGNIGEYFTGPSQWYFVDLEEENSSRPQPWTNKDQMQSEALADKTTYKWRDNAVNFYVTTGLVGGSCALGSDSMVNMAWINEGWLIVHETGHFFQLFHTFGGCQCSTGTGNCFQTQFGAYVGDDGIADTLPERDCFTRDILSSANYGTVYNNPARTAAERKLIDDTFFNIMSYHSGDENGNGNRDGFQSRLTELQLNKWADVANTQRLNVVSGKTWFVSTAGADANPGLASTQPKRRIDLTIAAANNAGGDIVLIAPGSYSDTVTINKPVTLRATHNGPVTLIKP